MSSYITLQVNNNGDLSFGLAWTEIGPTPFPITTYPVVAIYQADVDTRGTGRVWYRTTRNATLLAKAANDIHSLTGTSVSLQWLFIATWDHVGYYSYGTDKVVLCMIMHVFYDYVLKVSHARPILHFFKSADVSNALLN